MVPNFVPSIVQKFKVTEGTALKAVELFRKTLQLPHENLERVEKPTLDLIPHLAPFHIQEGDSEESEEKFVNRSRAYHAEMQTILKENKRRHEVFDAAQEAFAAFTEKLSAVQRWHSSLLVALPSLLDMVKDESSHVVADVKRKRRQTSKEDQDDEEDAQPPKERRKISHALGNVFQRIKGLTEPDEQGAYLSAIPVTFAPEQQASLASLLVSFERSLVNILERTSRVTDSSSPSQVDTVLIDVLPVIGDSLRELASIGREWRSGQLSNPPGWSQIDRPFVAGVEPTVALFSTDNVKLPEAGIGSNPTDASSELSPPAPLNLPADGESLPEGGSDAKRQSSADTLPVNDTEALPVERYGTCTEVNVPSNAHPEEHVGEIKSGIKVTSSEEPPASSLENGEGADGVGLDPSEGLLQFPLATLPEGSEETQSLPSSDTRRMKVTSSEEPPSSSLENGEGADGVGLDPSEAQLQFPLATLPEVSEETQSSPSSDTHTFVEQVNDSPTE